MYKIMLFLMGVGLLYGCQFYRVEVEQGNRLDATRVEKIQLGMDRKTVANLLGDPVMDSRLHKDRWIYVYNKRIGNKIIKQQKLILQFRNNQLVQIKQ